jgi:hypothetical protein
MPFFIKYIYKHINTQFKSFKMATFHVDTIWQPGLVGVSRLLHHLVL